MKFIFKKLGISSREEFWKLAIQFIKFGLVGVSNTAVSMAIYYLFIWFGEEYYLLGNVAGWVVSVFTGFCLNNRFVFSESKSGFWKKLLRTYIAYGGSFLLGTALLAIQVQGLGISAALAPWINMVITIPLNFILNKFWAFKA